jgi:hypothetical protein
MGRSGSKSRCAALQLSSDLGLSDQKVGDYVKKTGHVNRK